MKVPKENSQYSLNSYHDMKQSFAGFISYPAFFSLLYVRCYSVLTMSKHYKGTTLKFMYSNHYKLIVFIHKVPSNHFLIILKMFLMYYYVKITRE